MKPSERVSRRECERTGCDRSDPARGRRLAALSLGTALLLTLGAWSSGLFSSAEGVVWTRLPLESGSAPSVVDAPGGDRLDGSWQLVTGFGDRPQPRLVRVEFDRERRVVETYAPVERDGTWQAWCTD